MIPENPVVGGTVLRRAAIASPGFVSGSTGWSINQDGSAEFNNVVIRNGSVISGKALFYSGTPAAGNLVASIAATAGTDGQGNAYLAGIATYDTSLLVAVSLDQGILEFYSAGSETGPWISVGFLSSTGVLQSSTAGAGQLELQVNTSVLLRATLAGGVQSLFPLTASDGLTVTNGETADTLTVSSGQAAGLLLQVTNTTSGAASALARLTVAATGDDWLGCRVAGDTVSRILLSNTAAGLPQIEFSPGSSAVDATVRRAAANLLEVLGADLDIATAGRGLQIKEGSNARSGAVALTAGAATVANTSVTASTRIQLTSNADGGTPGWLRSDSRTPGTSFHIQSSSVTDTSTVAWLLIEPG